MTSVFHTLSERGFIVQSSDEDMPRMLRDSRMTVYAGFDPTADSLHLGHMVPLMALAHMQRAGHRVIVVVGGATGMVGDPSGKSAERPVLTPEQVAANMRGIRKQISRFVDFEGSNAAVMHDNNEWIGRMSFIDWLREVGRYFTVNYMLAKDSVDARLRAEHGITYTEFSYMTMQAYDFLHLFDRYGCALQCGGTDQWGNITAGIDLIRRLRQAKAYGLTFPLIETAAGEKFGKSAGNAVWLDPARTPPWEMYQYLVRQDDRDVVRFLNLFTFLPPNAIRELEEAVQTSAEERAAQRALAYEVCALMHGPDKAAEMRRAAEVLYGSEIRDLTDEAIQDLFRDVPSAMLPRAELEAGAPLLDLLVRTKLVPSRSEARRLLKSGGVYVNNVRVTEPIALGTNHLASPSALVLRAGKRNYRLVTIV